jgi:hypothetical protein
VKLRCQLLSFLRIHPLDCRHCNGSEMSGHEMRKRLEELNRRAPTNLLEKRAHGEGLETFDSKPNGAVARAPISLAQRGKKAG